MADAHSDRGARVARPLSPHLQIYKMPISMLMSIVHRITGAALYFGSALLAWWLISAAVSPEYFNYVASWFQTWLGKVMMLGYTWALLHHMMGGLRHFVWDFGHGYELATVDKMSWGSLAASLIGTAAIWFCVSMNSGAVAP